MSLPRIENNMTKINLNDISIFKDILEESNLTATDLNLSNKDLEIDLNELGIDVEDLDDEYIKKIIFKKRFEKYILENTYLNNDSINEFINEIVEDHFENFENFKELNKFNDLIDEFQIFDREEFIFNSITNWEKVDEYHLANAEMKFACEILSQNIDYITKLVRYNYMGRHRGGYAYIARGKIITHIC